MKTTLAPSRNWMMKAAAREADCDISAGPVLPAVAIGHPAAAARVKPVTYFTKLKAIVRKEEKAEAERHFFDASSWVLNDKPASKKK